MDWRLQDARFSISRTNERVKIVNAKVEKLKANMNAMKKDTDMVTVIAEEIVRLQEIVLLLANETKGEEEKVKLQKLVLSLTNEIMGKDEKEEEEEEDPDYKEKQ